VTILFSIKNISAVFSFLVSWTYLKIRYSIQKYLFCEKKQFIPIHHNCAQILYNNGAGAGLLGISASDASQVFLLIAAVVVIGGSYV